MTPAVSRRRFSAGQRTPRPRPEAVAVVGLFVLAVLFALYTASILLVPLALALFLNLLLRPVVRGLYGLGLPEPVGAGLTVVVLAGLLGLGVYGLAEPAGNWIGRLPVVLDELEFKLGVLRESVEEARQAAERLEEVTGGDEATRTAQTGPGLTGRIIEQAQAVVGQFLITLVLLYFLLARGRAMFERVLEAFPSIEQRLHVAGLASSVERKISTYLLTITMVSVALWTIVAIVMTVLGMPNPVLWGVVAGTFNFVPYVGSAVTFSVISVVSLLSFDTLTRIVAPPLAFLALTSLEGNFVTPTILGHRLTLNPVAVFLSILFWGWLWGIVGGIIAVPILAVIKILCDSSKTMRPLGALLG